MSRALGSRQSGATSWETCQSVLMLTTMPLDLCLQVDSRALCFNTAASPDSLCFWLPQMSKPRSSSFFSFHLCFLYFHSGIVKHFLRKKPDLLQARSSGLWLLNYSWFSIAFLFKPVNPKGSQAWRFTGSSSPLATWCKELTHLKIPWCWERLRAGGEGDGRGWDGWMASPTWWTWVQVDSSSWWRTGRPGMLWFMGSQRVRHDWASEQNWTEVRVLLIS